jgi:hypothetical protein
VEAERGNAFIATFLDAEREKKGCVLFTWPSIGLHTKSENGDCIEERLELLNRVKHNRVVA